MWMRHRCDRGLEPARRASALVRSSSTSIPCRSAPRCPGARARAVLTKSDEHHNIKRKSMSDTPFCTNRRTDRRHHLNRPEKRNASTRHGVALRDAWSARTRAERVGGSSTRESISRRAGHRTRRTIFQRVFPTSAFRFANRDCATGGWVGAAASGSCRCAISALPTRRPVSCSPGQGRFHRSADRGLAARIPHKVAMEPQLLARR